MKQWGRNRIRQELKMKKMSDYCLRKAMEEIDIDEYENTLRELLEKKKASVSAANDYQRNSKAATYAIGRGFEPALVWEMIKGERD